MNKDEMEGKWEQAIGRAQPADEGHEVRQPRRPEPRRPRPQAAKKELRIAFEREPKGARRRAA